MNKLYLGFDKNIELPKRNFLYLADEIPDIPRARVFDLTLHSLNPLKKITYKKARELADVLYTLYPQGENTLTVRNGKRALLPALLTTTRLDRVSKNYKLNERLSKETQQELESLFNDLLASPVLKHIFCRNKNVFSFNPNSVILVRINKAELGTFDALALGLVVINHYKGQLVIPDFGFYGRDTHINLIHENRLIAGVNFLNELPLRLRQTLLSIPDPVLNRALYPDARMVADFQGLRPDPSRQVLGNPYDDFISAALQ